jgi:AcrR family transcriptional regulator
MWVGVNIRAMSSRSGYHHGDLRNALVDAASKLAERGGPDAVTIRAAAREVGVTPTAAYRHFSGHEGLLEAAKYASLRRMTKAMRRRLAAVPDGGSDADPIGRSPGWRRSATGTSTSRSPSPGCSAPRSAAACRASTSATSRP